MADRTVVHKGVRKKKRPYSLKGRLKFVFYAFIIYFILLLGKLVYLQVFDRSDQYAAQLDQLVDEVQITAQRGNIYDRNMNVLVQDSSAKSVNIIPKSVKDQDVLVEKISDIIDVDPEKVIEICNQLEDDRVEISDNTAGKDVDTLLNTLDNDEAYEVDRGAFYVRPIKVENPESDSRVIAQALDMESDTVLKYLTSKENSAQLVKNKVDNADAEELKASVAIYDETGELQSYNGLELIEDKKRYYTNGNFASYILGFTGSDHEGLYGVEKTFNDTLKGTNGIVYHQKDAQGNLITSQTKVLQESEKGSDLILSIDSNVQSAAERQLENAVETWHAKSGTAIVMNSKTGEVVAMASKPDYDLNDPYSVSEDYQTKHAADLEGLTDAQKAEQMWRNPAVSFIYEPGSTFKPITISTALEEGAVNPSMTFTCTGSIYIDGTTINCEGIHGVQTIAETLENSCNPGLVQIIQGVDPNIFYKYIYNFGFGKKTGIELTGEESGIVNRVFQEDNTINMVDYSTISFGQGIATTPIQITAALNSLINNGYYVTPTILKSEGSESPIQVISQSTSDAIKEDMHGVLTSKTALNNLTGGYDMGGKTGTAEKFVNGEYTAGVNVTSFFCFAPVDDPQYACLVVLDEPDAEAFGATSAAPAAIEILKQALIYSGSNPNENSAASVQIPDLVGQNLEKAQKLLEERGIEFTVNQIGEEDIVLTQSIPAQTPYVSGNVLTLTVGNKASLDEKIVPDFTGMTIQSVNEQVRALGLHLEIKGNGFAVEQSIAPGTTVEEDQTIIVKFEE